LDVAAHGVRRCLDERLVALAEVIFGKEIIEKLVVSFPPF